MNKECYKCPITCGLLSPGHMYCPHEAESLQLYWISLEGCSSHPANPFALVWKATTSGAELKGGVSLKLPVLGYSPRVTHLPAPRGDMCPFGAAAGSHGVFSGASSQMGAIFLEITRDISTALGDAIFLSLLEVKDVAALCMFLHLGEVFV